MICYNTDKRHPSAQSHNIMSLRSVESSTFDAWRVGGCLAVFLFSISTIGLLFAVEDQDKVKRCLRAGATPEHCLLTVYGR